MHFIIWHYLEAKDLFLSSIFFYQIVGNGRIKQNAATETKCTTVFFCTICLNIFIQKMFNKSESWVFVLSHGASHGQKKRTGVANWCSDLQSIAGSMWQGGLWGVGKHKKPWLRHQAEPLVVTCHFPSGRMATLANLWTCWLQLPHARAGGKIKYSLLTSWYQTSNWAATFSWPVSADTDLHMFKDARTLQGSDSISYAETNWNSAASAIKIKRILMKLISFFLFCFVFLIKALLIAKVYRRT